MNKELLEDFIEGFGLDVNRREAVDSVASKGWSEFWASRISGYDYYGENRSLKYFLIEEIRKLLIDRTDRLSVVDIGSGRHISPGVFRNTS